MVGLKNNVAAIEKMNKKTKTHIFCIGHTKLCLNIPKSAYLIRTTRGFLDDGVHQKLISLDSVSEELDFHYPYLGGTAGMLAIPDIFRSEKISYQADDKIMIFQQAKFVAYRSIGWESKNYPGMKILSHWLAQGVDLESVAGLADDFLLPQLLMQPGGEMNVYAHYHHLPDFLRFCAVVIDEGVLTPHEVVEMCKQETFIPGGGLLGASPVEYFLDMTETLKRVAIAFLTRHRPSLTSAYQRIAAAYCLERLSSYLLVKRLVENYGMIPDKFIGHMISVTDSDYVGGSSNFKK